MRKRYLSNLYLACICTLVLIGLCEAMYDCVIGKTCGCEMETICKNIKAKPLCCDSACISMYPPPKPFPAPLCCKPPHPCTPIPTTLSSTPKETTTTFRANNNESAIKDHSAAIIGGSIAGSIAGAAVLAVIMFVALRSMNKRRLLVHSSSSATGLSVHDGAFITSSVVLIRSPPSSRSCSNPSNSDSISFPDVNNSGAM